MNVMRAARWIIGTALVIGLVWIGNRVNNTHLMTLIVGGPRIDVPFMVSQKGAVIEKSFHVPRDEYFAFTLDLYFRPGDGKDRTRVQKLAGIDMATQTENNGISMPVKLTIDGTTASGRKISIQREVHSEATEGYGAAFFKTIYETDLKKGDYQIKLESLADVAELADVPVRFDVRVPGNRK